MSYSAVCRTLFSVILLVHYVHAVGEDATRGASEASVDSWIAVNDYVDEHYGASWDLLGILLDVPEGTESSEYSRYLRRLNCISRVLEKRSEAIEPRVGEKYGPTPHANLSRLFQEMLARGFFTEVYERHGDTPTGCPRDELWVPQYIRLLRDLSGCVEHADGTDLFTYLHRQIISDAKAFGASDEVLDTISSSLTGVFSSFDELSASWLRYLGSDNPDSAANIKYLRSDAAEQKRMDAEHIAQGIGDRHVFNSSNYSSILRNIKERCEPIYCERFSDLFASVHALAYSKILPYGADVPVEVKTRHMRMVYSLYAVEYSIWLIRHLNSLAGPEDKCSSYDFTDMCYRLVADDGFVKGILRVTSESDDDPYNTIYKKISERIKTLNENYDMRVVLQKQSFIKLLATLLTVSVFKVEKISERPGDSNIRYSKAQSVVSEINELIRGTGNPSLKSKSGSSTGSTNTPTDDEIKQYKALIEALKSLDLTEGGIAKLQAASQSTEDIESLGSPAPQPQLLDGQQRTLETLSSRLNYLFILMCLLLVLVVVLVLIYAIKLGVI